MAMQDVALMLLSAYSFLAGLFVAVVVLELVAMWRIFSKAGEGGWKCLIPVYNFYVLCKISWSPSIFWVMFALTFVESYAAQFTSSFTALIASAAAIAYFVLLIVQQHKLARAFGRGVGFTVGLVLLNPIFMMILGLGGATYSGADL